MGVGKTGPKSEVAHKISGLTERGSGQASGPPALLYAIEPDSALPGGCGFRFSPTSGLFEADSAPRFVGAPPPLRIARLCFQSPLWTS